MAMEQPSQARVIEVNPTKIQEKIESGLEQIYGLAKASYGPKAGIALIEAPFGAPLASRDGVTNIRKAILEEPTENMANKVAKQASEQSNTRVGDGTTAVTILTYHLYKAARE